VSHAVRGLEARTDAQWWNPKGMSWDAAAQFLLPAGGRVAVPGGQEVFDLFLSIGYDAFHLSRAAGTRAPGGRAIFSACDKGLSAEEVLSRAGLSAGAPQVLDPSANVVLTVWRRKSP
jgi:hypothetical protein